MRIKIIGIMHLSYSKIWLNKFNCINLRWATRALPSACNVCKIFFFTFAVRELGFDLRSRLGPKKSETKLVITKNVQVDARQKLKRRTHKVNENGKYEDDEEQNGEDNEHEISPSLSRKTVVIKQDDKEAELDAKIFRIQRMNEEIRKRQEEIEREKMLYA
jgi:hypothetical protein